MILHLLIDEKFSDYVVEQFSGAEMQSDFVLVSATRQMKYFHSIEKVRVVNPQNDLEIHQLLIDISNYNSVIFHGLFFQWQEWIINNWPTGVKIGWVCWGGEIYAQHDIRDSFLKPLSKFAKKLHWWRHRQEPWIFPKDLIQRTDYCLTCTSAEYDYVKNYLSVPIQHLWYTYYSIEDTIGSLKECRCKGHNIFIGNSATIECNYLETLMQVRKLSIGNRNIIIPLSYGEPWVRNMCLKWGKLLFGNHFTPLVNFIPREAYNATMLDCSVMIQPHLREQAHGNIVTGLWLGMRVYLSENGIDYKHFKDIGCIVFSIERDLQCGNLNALAPMSDIDVAHNRQILLAVYGKEHVNFEIRNIVKNIA